MTAPIQETFSQTINRRMVELGINQIELERRSFISDTAWAHWRTGKILPKKSMITGICKALEVDESELREKIEKERDSRRCGIKIDTVEQTRAVIHDLKNNAQADA